MHIALTGYKRCGKDEVTAVLIREHGYKRHSFGDIIKRQLDPLVQLHLGFSAFTEEDSQKNIIRPLLEVWSEVNNPGLLKEFFQSIPARAINNRCVKLSEARAWTDNGGLIVWVNRPGAVPASAWETNQLTAVREAGLIAAEIDNDGPLTELPAKVAKLLQFLRQVKPVRCRSGETLELPLWDK